MKDSELALLDQVPTPLFVLEAPGGDEVSYAFFNKAAIDVAKFNLEDYVGLNATHLYHGEYGEYAYQKHTECYLTAEPSTYVLTLPINGKLRSIRTKLMPILDTDGLVTHIIGTSVELTAEHEAGEIHNESRVVEKELQEFMYLAAHDLRSPMQRVHQFADMLREDFEDMGDGKLELIDMLERIATESMSMIQAILRYAETTSRPECIENFSLLALSNSILVTLDPDSFHQCRIDDCAIHGDRTIIQAVLRNIIDNAFKHNAPDCVSLDVSVVNAKSGFFTMQITDNGKGMYAPDKLFKNSDNSHRSKSGFGLLAIRKLIAKAGGEITAAHPSEGTGLVVTVTLPGTVAFGPQQVNAAGVSFEGV